MKAEADIYDRNTKACKDRMEKVLSIAYAPSKGEVPKGALDAFVAQVKPIAELKNEAYAYITAATAQQLLLLFRQ